MEATQTTNSTKTLELIFDNGGSATLQVSDGNHSYCHNYEDMAQCARDCKALLFGAAWPSDFNGWEGNEPECWIDTTTDQFADHVKAGGYQFYELSDFDNLDHEGQIESGWNNIDLFFETLSK